MNKLFANIALLSLGWFLASCGGGDDTSASSSPTQTIARIEIGSDGLLLLGNGQVSQLSLKAFDDKGAEVSAPAVQWQSSASTQLTVDATGKLTAQTANGSAMITATAGSISSAPSWRLSVSPRRARSSSNPLTSR